MTIAMDTMNYSLTPRDYMYPSARLLPNEVDTLVREMCVVADACVYDAHAGAEHSVKSMLRPYDSATTTAKHHNLPHPSAPVPRQPDEPSFAFALPDKEAQAKGEGDNCNHCGWTHDLEFEAGTGESVESRTTRQLADLIVNLKRAGRDQEAIELLTGAGGRTIDGFPSKEEPLHMYEAAGQASPYSDQESDPSRKAGRQFYTFTSTNSWR